LPSASAGVPDTIKAAQSARTILLDILRSFQSCLDAMV
jgi:hypothetical protein